MPKTKDSERKEAAKMDTTAESPKTGLNAKAADRFLPSLRHGGQYITRSGPVTPTEVP